MKLRTLRSRGRRPGADAGFSLIETVIALLVALLVTAAVFALLNPARTMASIQPEAIDMLQRARLGSDAVFRDLMAAGAGIDAGALTGPLANYFPPIVPRRMGLRHADAPTVARADVVTVTYVPRMAAQATLARPMPRFGDMQVNVHPSCFLAQPLCGFAEDMTIVVFDTLGQFDLFDITQVIGGVGHLRAHEVQPAGRYEPGALVAEAEVHTYYFDAAASQLRHYDGDQTDVPVVDNVVAFALEYFGDPEPPAAPRPPPGVANCLYDAVGAANPMPGLAPSGGSLAPLPLAMLADGPWCGSGSNQFDADLLRVRRVRVTLRVQAAPVTLRSIAPAFANPGTSRASSRYLPDFVTTLDVSPRNLSLGR